MTSTEHPAPQTLADLVSGRLDDGESETVISHISECGTCLAVVDGLWDDPQAEAGGAVPDLDPETARRVEQRLRRRIDRNNLVAQVVRLGTHALWTALVALLQPLFNIGSSR